MKPTAPLLVLTGIVRASDATAILDRLAGKPVHAAHIKEHQSTSKTGQAFTVKEHDDTRQAAVRQAQPGSHLIYDDGRSGHQGKKAKVLENTGTHLHVQFEDRADTTTIAHHDKGWMDHLSVHEDNEVGNNTADDKRDRTKPRPLTPDQAAAMREHGYNASDSARDPGPVRAGAPEEQPMAVHCRDEGLEIITAASARWELDQPTSFQWMPGGVTTLTPTYDGHPIKLTVQCDAATAECVQASFDSWRKKYPKLRPFGCVEHREEEAAIFPDNFEWKNEPEPGVFCTALPTELGARNVNGRIHRSWSPSFTTDAEYHKCRCADCQQPAQACDCGGPQAFPDGARGSASNPARITGVAFSVGSLTNKPAFKNILPVRAKEGGQVDATHISEHQSTSKSGNVYTVKEHEDARAAATNRADAETANAHQRSKSAAKPSDQQGWDHRVAEHAHAAAAESHRAAAKAHSTGPASKRTPQAVIYHEEAAKHHEKHAAYHRSEGDKVAGMAVRTSDAILDRLAGIPVHAVHVKEHQSTSKSGAVFTVKEHEDARQASHAAFRASATAADQSMRAHASKDPKEHAKATEAHNAAASAHWSAEVAHQKAGDPFGMQADHHEYWSAAGKKSAAHTAHTAALTPPKEDVRSNNETWGFYGEAHSSALRSIMGDAYDNNDPSEDQRQAADAHAATAFSKAANELVDAGHVRTHEQARDFLDSTHGRHLADEVGHTGSVATSKHIGSMTKHWLKSQLTAEDAKHKNQATDAGPEDAEAILARLSAQQPATVRAVDVLDRLSHKT